MAEKRMFTKTIIDSDAFLDMPLSTQCLYFHLSMRADDDGFINNPKKLQRMIGCADDDLKILIAKRFIIPFESGVVVIKHWKMHNYIQKDRYKETVYLKEKELLTIKDNKAYTLKNEEEILLDTECIQDEYSSLPQVRLDKISIDKKKTIPLKKESKVKISFTDDDKEYLLAKYLSKQISKRLDRPLQTEKILQNWSADFEKMVRLDKIDIEDIKNVLVFSQQDDFWQTNILSASKFRKQYLQLLSKMKNNNNNNKQSSLGNLLEMIEGGTFDE